MSVVALGLATASCDEYLDINTDPNAPSGDVVTSSMIMPGVEMNLATCYGNFMRITGGYYAQHYAQSFGTSNYVDFSAFYMSAARSSSNYTQMMLRVIGNANIIKEKSSAVEEWGTYLAASTLRAFAYEALIDCYGEMPYSEAFTATTAPKYDDGKDVYVGLVNELDEALAKVSPSDFVCTNFLYPGKSADLWIKFANSLKLRLLTRGGDKMGSQTALDALVNEGNFITSDVQWAGCWSSESGSESPFFAEEFATNFGSTQINVIANIALLGTMNQGSYFDPRTAAFWLKGSNDQYNGYISSNTQIVQGTVDAEGTACDAAYFSRPVASYNMPVVILSLSDVEFYLAEYYAKKNDAANAQAHYEAGIAASFASAGVEGAAANIAQYPYNQTDWKKCIGLAKWIANSGFNGFEAWCEMRRLGQPAFSDQKGEDFDDNSKSFDPSSYEPGTIYTPRNVRSEIGSKSLLQRWPYPESSTSRNSNAPKFPGHTSPVFWAE